MGPWEQNKQMSMYALFSAICGAILGAAGATALERRAPGSIPNPAGTPSEFGEALKRVIGKNEVFKLSPGRGWTRGGCMVLGRALARWIGPEAELVVVSVAHVPVEHVAVKVGDLYIDGNGVANEEWFRFAQYESILRTHDFIGKNFKIRISPLTKAKERAATKGRISCPAEAVDHLVALFDRELGRPAEWGIGSEVPSRFTIERGVQRSGIVEFVVTTTGGYCNGFVGTQEQWREVKDPAPDAFEDENIVAYAAKLHVDPDERRSGLGRALLCELLRAFRARGAKVFWLVAHSDGAADRGLSQRELIEWYERLGMVEVSKDELHGVVSEVLARCSSGNAAP